MTLSPKLSELVLSSVGRGVGLAQLSDFHKQMLLPHPYLRGQLAMFGDRFPWFLPLDKERLGEHRYYWYLLDARDATHNMKSTGHQHRHTTASTKDYPTWDVSVKIEEVCTNQVEDLANFKIMNWFGLAWMCTRTAIYKMWNFDLQWLSNDIQRIVKYFELRLRFC